MLSNMTLLDLQVLLESSTSPVTLAGFAFGTHRDCATTTAADAIVAQEIASENALHAILTKMFSPTATRWYPGSLIGDLMPAGYLVPVRGKSPSDPVHLRYLAAPIFVGTKEDGFPNHPFHMVGFSGADVYSRGQDMEGKSLADGSLSVTSLSYDAQLTASSPIHWRSVPISRKPSRTKLLQDKYPSSFEAITSKISNLLQAATEDDSFNGHWVTGQAPQRISIPAIFPVPYNSAFTLSSDVPLHNGIGTPENKASLADLFKSAGAYKSEFLLNDPVFDLFVEAVSSYPDSFVPVDCLSNEFSSLPFSELQESARASVFLLIADKLDFLHTDASLPLQSYKQAPLSLFQIPSWDARMQPMFMSCPAPMVGLKSIFAMTDMQMSPTGTHGTAHHVSVPQVPNWHQQPSASSATMTGNLFSSIMTGANQGGGKITNAGSNPALKLSHSQETVKTMGLIDFASRRGVFPCTPASQDFELATVDSSSPTGMQKITQTSDFLLAELNTYAENPDTINRINCVKDNFQQCQGEMGLVSTHCQRACSDVTRFFCQDVFGKLLAGPLCQAALSGQPFTGFSPIMCLLLFDDVELKAGLPLLPYDGFPSYDLAEDFVGSVVILLTYIWSYNHCQHTLLFQGYSHLLRCLQASNLKVNWKNSNFPRAAYSLTLLELVHNLFTYIAKHASCMPTKSRRYILLKSSNGLYSDVISVPSEVQTLQSKTTFSDVITKWFEQCDSAFSVVTSSSTGILSSTFTESAIIPHFLFKRKHLYQAPLPPPAGGHHSLPPVTDDPFNTPPKKKGRRGDKEPLVKGPSKKPLKAPLGSHIVDPVSTHPDARAQIASFNLPKPPGGIQPFQNPTGTLHSKLCLTYLSGLECDGANPCGYHLHVDARSLSSPPTAYKPLREYFITHCTVIKASPAALANRTLFPTAQ